MKTLAISHLFISCIALIPLFKANSAYNNQPEFNTDNLSLSGYSQAFPPLPTDTNDNELDGRSLGLLQDAINESNTSTDSHDYRTSTSSDQYERVPTPDNSWSDSDTVFIDGNGRDAVAETSLDAVVGFCIPEHGPRTASNDFLCDGCPYGKN